MTWGPIELSAGLNKIWNSKSDRLLVGESVVLARLGLISPSIFDVIICLTPCELISNYNDNLVSSKKKIEPFQLYSGSKDEEDNNAVAKWGVGGGRGVGGEGYTPSAPPSTPSDVNSLSGMIGGLFLSTYGSVPTAGSAPSSPRESTLNEDPNPGGKNSVGSIVVPGLDDPLAQGDLGRVDGCTG